MKKQVASAVQRRALAAIKILHSSMNLKADWNDPELRALRRGIGLSIGTIETDLLSVIYKEFPALDDLTDLK